jgi:hypothetical protein
MGDARPLADFLLTQRPRGLAATGLGNAAARRWHSGGEPGSRRITVGGTTQAVSRDLSNDRQEIRVEQA